MCYYKSLHVKQNQVIPTFDLTIPDDFTRIVQNGFDYSLWPVIRPNAECGTEVVLMEWGLIPDYVYTREAVEQSRRTYNGLNAIGEELLEKRMYKDAAANRRCVVLSSGFYEWRHLPRIGKNGQPLKTVDKYPYYIKLKGRDVFFMAGIWQPWKDPETDTTVNSFALVTTKANSLMEQIHNSKKRMPLILTDELAAEWISDIPQQRIKEIATFQIPAEEMEAYTIQKNFRESQEPLPFTYDIPALQ